MQANRVGSQTNLSPLLVTIFAFTSGAIVANIYYSQPIIDMIAMETGLSLNNAGFIVSLTQLGYALGLFFIVPLVDLLENKKLALATIFMTFISLIITALSQQPSVLLLASIFIGISSVSAQILIPIASRLASDHNRGRVIGNIMSGLFLGVLLARPLSSLIAEYFGWRMVFISSAVMMLLVAAIVGGAIPKHRSAAEGTYVTLITSLWRLLKQQPVLRQRSLYQALMFASFSLFWTAAPLRLISHYGYTQTGIALFALVGAAGVISAPLSGRLADKGYSHLATVGSLSLGVVSFIPSFSIIGLVVSGIVLNLAVQMSLVLGQREVYSLDTTSSGRLNALYMTSIFIGGAVGSAIAGFALHHGGWLLVSVMGSLFPLIALTFYLKNYSQSMLQLVKNYK